MTPAGKITFCYLEEDNPQKSFFRIKPLICAGDAFPADLGEIVRQYSDEGGIRIVPDKNEALRFKSRMRTLGCFCLLDLTKHPGETDKIRPNKNYSPERGEFNRNIVYSDVILACPEHFAYEVLTPETDESGACTLPGDTLIRTRHVYLDLDGKISGPFTAEKPDDAARFTLTPAPDTKIAEAAPERLYEFEAGGCKIKLYLAGLQTVLPANEKAPEPAAEKPAESPAAEKPAAEPAPAEEPLPAKPAPTPAAQPVKSAPEKPAARTPYRPDQWEGKLGLNPRRGKSLSEVVDEGWRHSRMEQLGVQLSSETVTNPVVSPVEAAQKAVAAAWKLEDGRAALIDSLAGLEFLPEALAEKAGITASGAARNTEMDSLEAERLSLLREIDDLNRDRATKRSELMDEAREAHRREIEKMEAEKHKLADECAARRRDADNARSAQIEAEKLLKQQNLRDLDQGFLRYALYTRAARILCEEPDSDPQEFLGTPSVFSPTGAQMISDIRSVFESAGLCLDNDGALNLLACIVLGRIVIFSGPTGCGKTALADAMASALGLKQPGACRYAKLSPEVTDVRKSAAFRALSSANDGLTLRAVLLDDINALPTADQARGMLFFADAPEHEDFTVMMTCLDDQLGYPLQPRILDRAFFIRIRPAKPDSWKRMPAVADKAQAPSLEMLRRVFHPDTPIPGEVVSRFELLEKRLAEVGIRLSARTRCDMYDYCAAVIPLMTGKPLHALDLAFAQRALPAIMATASPAAILALPDILADLPESIALLNEPIALPPM